MGPLVFTILIFVVIVGISLGLYYVWQRSRSRKLQAERIDSAINLKPRIDETKEGEEGATAEEAPTFEEGKLRKDKRYSTIPWLDNILRNFLKKSTPVLLRLIEQSGLSIKVSEFFLVSAIVGFLGAAIVNFIVHLPFIGLGLGMFPYMILNYIKEKRTAKFISQMPPALDLLNSDLKAGVDILAGFKHVAEDMDPPMSEEIGKLIVEINLGLPINDALGNLSDRIDTMDVQMLCTGISINREIGGNLSELITKVSATVRERFRLRGIIASLTAEGKMSAWLLIGLPFIMFGILNGMAPETYGSFLNDPIGKNIMGGCCVSMIIGYILINKITTLDV